MNINFKIVSGILAAGYAYELYANNTNIKRAASARSKLIELVKYQASMLDQHKVPYTDFDMIAMQEIANSK